MLYQSRAIILRTVKFGETSLIVDTYTEQKGFQTFVINSVRKAKAITPASFLQLLSLVDIVAYHQENREINRIKELRLEFTFQRIPFDRNQSAVILCLAEILSKVVRSSYPDERLFQYIHKSLLTYDHAPEIDRDFLIRFLVNLTPYLGFGFDYQNECKKDEVFDLLAGELIRIEDGGSYLLTCEEYSTLRSILLNPAIPPMPIPYAMRTRLVDQVILYYQVHLESLKEVKSLPILRELM